MTEKRIMPCENVREAHNVNAQMRRELKAKEDQNCAAEKALKSLHRRKRKRLKNKFDFF